MITGNDDDIESFDPNEVMAKAYMAKKPDDDPKVSSKSQGGPLAFLGLQKTTTTTGDIPEKKIIEDKSVDGWTTEKIDESKEKKITEDKSVDGWTKETNSKNVEKEATNETEKKKDDTSSTDDGSHGETEQDDKNTGNEKDDGMEIQIFFYNDGGGRKIFKFPNYFMSNGTIY